MIRKLKLQCVRTAAVGAVLAATLGTANATLVFLSAIPNAWRLQDYAGQTGTGNLVLWFTGSTCTNGQLMINASTEQEKNRLWSTVMAAKVANRHMFVYYDDATCLISSFGMDDQ
jgi:hypothetical protein